VGVWNATGAAKLTALGLHALQHRGQEASGIVSYDRSAERFFSKKGRGRVQQVFGGPRDMDGLPGGGAIGHNRYATTGEDMASNIQPMFAEFSFGGFAIAHNGNLTNALKIRQRLVNEGSIFQSSNDTEVIIHLIARSVRATLVERVVDALSQLEGAYSLVALSRKKLIGVRDPLGVRPLAVGRIKGEDGKNAYTLASESCAFDILGAEFVRELDPGEMVIIDDEQITYTKPFPTMKPRPCIFEHIYFARPDSTIGGRSVYESRKRIGQELARESHPQGGVDIIVPVPDSGVPAAIGYAAESGVPFELGIVRSHYVGRTFIQPTQSIRDLGVRMKHSANAALLKGKRVVLVDDSIVRGTTSAKIVDMVRRAGAAEVHMRISSPPTTNPCFYGIDTPDKSELLAARFAIDEMAKEIKADSLAFVSTDGLYRAMGEAGGRNTNQPQYCDACFTGAYPTRLVDVDANLVGATPGRPIEQAAE
ncbi:MAG: amidophosphoribosyltransferase, partial [Alphaproteobacteria bacterium]